MYTKVAAKLHMHMHHTRIYYSYPLDSAVPWSDFLCSQCFLEIGAASSLSYFLYLPKFATDCGVTSSSSIADHGSK